MFRRGSASQRLFQFIRHIGADKNSLSISHIVSGSPCESDSTTNKNCSALGMRTRYAMHGFATPLVAGNAHGK